MDDSNVRRVAVLFSGGTDSTASSALLTETFQEIHLLSYERAGFHGISNSRYNAGKLRARFPEHRIVHRLLETTPLARHVTNHNRFRYFLKYGFFTLQNCGFCALLNHTGSLAYCLKHGIRDVADGITYDWPFFPGHMDKVIQLFREMYAEFGITYHTPVLHCDIDRPMRYLDKLIGDGDVPQPEENRDTTGKILKRLGLSDTENYKGTELDKKAQARCFQFVLPNIFVYWVYNAPQRWDSYEAQVVEYFGHLIQDISGLVRKHHEEGSHPELFTFLDTPPDCP